MDVINPRHISDQEELKLAEATWQYQQWMTMGDFTKPPLDPIGTSFRTDKWSELVPGVGYQSEQHYFKRQVQMVMDELDRLGYDLVKRPVKTGN